MILRLVLCWLLCLAGAARAGGDTPPPRLLLAETWSEARSLDLADYWVSEKLDGVRAVWDGHDLRFRSGRPVPAPDWFIAALPAEEALDGELWLGRQQFDALSATVRKARPVDAEWRLVRYMIFDQPEGAGDFTARLSHLRAVLAQHPAPFVQLIEQFKVPSRKALQRKLREVVAAGGEGLMLHRADAPYRSGRHDDLLKLKPWQDTEAVVVAILPGRGKWTGQMGALLMEMPDGKRFRLGAGFSAEERRNPPAPGTLLTYRYTSLTPAGLPRFPRFWRIRQVF
ncbi:DNA ligase [Denitratisoma sp. agr-D3]